MNILFLIPLVLLGLGVFALFFKLVDLFECI